MDHWYNNIEKRYLVQVAMMFQANIIFVFIYRFDIQGREE